MQSTKTTLLPHVRRLGMLVGFAFFILFIYTASHEVANPRIAAGTERKQVAIATGQSNETSLNSNLTQAGYVTAVSSTASPVGTPTKRSNEGEEGPKSTKSHADIASQLASADDNHFSEQIDDNAVSLHKTPRDL